MENREMAKKKVICGNVDCKECEHFDIKWHDFGHVVYYCRENPNKIQYASIKNENENCVEFKRRLSIWERIFRL